MAINVSIDKYLKNPTKVLPTSFIEYKTKAILKNEKRVLDEDFNSIEFDNYNDTKIIRMVNYLFSIKSDSLEKHVQFKTFMKDASTADFLLDEDFYFLLSTIFHISDEEYNRICKEVDDKGYQSELCFILYTTKYSKSNKQKRRYYPAAICFGDLDRNINEAHINYIGVLPEYQATNYFQYVLQEFLLRVANLDGTFVTCNVPFESPYLDNYHDCGFQDDCIWHFLRLK